MLSTIYAETINVQCRYAECHKYAHYAECLYAECRYAECCGADLIIEEMQF